MACRNGLRRDESGKVEIDPIYLPTPALRDELRLRLRHLGLALDRRDRAEGEGRSILRAVLALMFESLTTTKQSDGAALLKVNTYRKVLLPLPLFAVVEACRRFASGQVAGVNKGFPPTAAQIADEARAIFAPWSAERANILELLNAKALPPPPKPGERERIARKFDALLGELGASVKMSAAAQAARPQPKDKFAAYRKREGNEIDGAGEDGMSVLRAGREWDAGAGGDPEGGEDGPGHGRSRGDPAGL